MSEYAKDYFYEKLKEQPATIKTIWEDYTDSEDLQFYELCKYFADISLNAPRWRVQGTCNVQACFQYSDINIAKEETYKYIENWNIKNVGTLLELIHDMHSYAVDFDDSRETGEIVRPENYDWQPGYAGEYYSFKSIPDDVWEKIANDINMNLKSKNNQ